MYQVHVTDQILDPKNLLNRNLGKKWVFECRKSRRKILHGRTYSTTLLQACTKKLLDVSCTSVLSCCFCFRDEVGAMDFACFGWRREQSISASYLNLCLPDSLAPKQTDGSILDVAQTRWYSPVLSATGGPTSAAQSNNSRIAIFLTQIARPRLTQTRRLKF